MAGRRLTVLAVLMLSASLVFAASSVVHFQRAEEAYEKGDYEKALKEYDALVEILGEDAAVRHNRALVFMALGEIGAAKAEAEQAVKLEPHEGKYLVTLGVICLMGEKQELKQAKKVLTRAAYVLLREKEWISLATAYYNLGVIAVRENDMKEAERFFKKAVDLNPGDERFSAALDAVSHEDTQWF